MTAPAIRTAYDERYSDIDHIETIGSDTTFHRGFGETGTRVELVDFSGTEVGGRLEDTGGCPRCGETEMVLSRDLHPDEHDSAVFYCTNLKCAHFVGDEVEYDMSRIRADTPEMWDNTATCPSCETRHTVEITRHSPMHDKANEGSSCIVTAFCDDCTNTLDENTSEVDA